MRILVPAAVVCALAVAVIGFATAPGGARRELFVDVPDATGVYAGAAIRESGIDVGGVASVTAIDHGRRARIGLTFSAPAWPLRRGDRLQQRWGGTISFLNGYLDLTRPASAGTAYRNGATLPPAALQASVQFDSLIDDFTPSVRAGLRAMLAGGGSSLSAARPGLEQTLTRTPPALGQANLLLAALNRSRAQLTGLVAASAHVVDALDTAQPTVAGLVDGAAQTLNATATQASALQQTIGQAPGTLIRVDTTLGTADRTLNLADWVTTQIAPGVRQLRETVAPLQLLLERVEQVAPDAEATLTTAGRSAPRISSLLIKATSLLPTIGADVQQATPELDCVRPYTPDIISFFTNWAAFMSVKDGDGFLARVVPSVILGAPSGAQPDTPAQAVKQYPGLTDAFPQPPGYAAGQPWFQPQCGITADSLDAADDPEANNPNDTPLPVTSVSAEKR